MYHLRQISLIPAQTEEPDPDIRFRELFIFRLIIALAALLKQNSPF